MEKKVKLSVEDYKPLVEASSLLAVGLITRRKLKKLGFNKRERFLYGSILGSLTSISFYLSSLRKELKKS